MQVDIQAIDVPLTQSIRDHIQRRIGFALGSRADRFKTVVVRVSNAEGTTGSGGKRCQVHVKLARLKDIIIQDTQPDLDTAIDRAVDRAGRTLNRILEREYHTRRRLFVPKPRLRPVRV